MSGLLLYLRREPTADSVWLPCGDGRTRYDIRAHRDRQGRHPAGFDE
jgi:hypothetical protein